MLCKAEFRTKMNFRRTIACLLIFFISATQLSAKKYLDSGEIAGIGSASVGVFGLGLLINNKTDHNPIIFKGPLPLERSIQKLLGGSYYAGKTNFLDNRFGSAITPLLGSIILFSADSRYPLGDRTKTVLQDQFLYFSGLTATWGVTSFFKGVFDRERPQTALYPDEAAERENINPRYDHQSFFSGHTSSAFFSMSFLNSRLRAIMRSEMSLENYHKWRWISPAVLYGWAGFVGWSRIHSYKHYLSDVLVGALAGYLVSELFLKIGDNLYSNQAQGNQNYIIKISLKF